MASDREARLKITLDADGKTANSELKNTGAALDETSKSADKAAFSFKGFAFSAAGVASSLISVSFNLLKLAQTYLGLTVNVETTNTKLKIFNFFVQNTRKEITISTEFLKQFASYLAAINVPPALVKIIDLMGDFRVKIGIGRGDKTIFEHTETGIKKAAEAVKNFQISELRNDIQQAAIALGVFAVQSYTTLKSLREGIARESAFSQASRTIEGTSQEVGALKTQLDNLAATKLAIPVDQLYEVAGVAGAMGKSVAEIPAFVELVSQAAVALNIPANELAEKLGTIQTQLDLTDEGLKSFADQVNTVADSMPGKVSELDIFQVLSTGVATAAKNFGLMKGETVALAGSLLSLGEAPETARSGLVNLLSSLQNAKNQTPDFQQGLAQLGTSADKLAADIKAKPLPALMELLEQMNGLSKAARLDIATKLLGKGQDAIALAKLVDNVDLLKEGLAQATDVQAYSGSVSAAYAKQIETVDAKLTLLKNSVNNLVESLTTTFLPAINNIIDGFRGLANSATKFSQNHPIFKTLAAISVSMLSIAGVTRLVGLALGVLSRVAIVPILRSIAIAAGATALSLEGLGVAGIGKLIIEITKGGGALKVFKALLMFFVGGPIGLAIGALGLLFVAISNLLPMTIKWGETTTTVGEAIRAVWNIIVTEAANAIKNVIAFYQSIADFLGLSAQFKALKDTVSGFIQAFDFGEALNASLENLAGFFNKIIGTAKAAMIAVKNIGILGSQAFNDKVKEAFNADYIGKMSQRVQSEIKKIQATQKLAVADKRPTDKGGELPLNQDPEQVKKQADLIAKIQKEQFDRTVQNIKDSEAAKIQELKNSGKTQKQIDDGIFAEKVKTQQLIFNELSNSLANELTALKDHATKKKTLNADELQAKKATLQEIQKSYKDNITALNQLEQEHRDKVISLDKEIRDLKKQGQDGLREIARSGMTDEQVAADKVLEIQEKTAQMRQLLKNKEYAQAAELGRELNALTLEQAKSAASAAKNGGDAGAANAAQRAYQASIGLTTEALKAQKAEEQAKADEAKAQAEIQRQTFQRVGDQIQALNDTLTQGSALKITVDTTEIDNAKQKIAELTGKTVSVGTETPAQPSVYKAGSNSYSDIKSVAENAARINPQQNQLPAYLTDLIRQLKPLNIPNISQVQNAQITQSAQEKILGVYKLELNTPAGTVNATIKASDKEIFEAVERYAKGRSRITRDY